MVLKVGEHYAEYSRYCHTYPDHQAIASKLYVSGGVFVLNAKGPLEDPKEGSDHPDSNLECPIVLQHCSHLTYLGP